MLLYFLIIYTILYHCINVENSIYSWREILINALEYLSNQCPHYTNRYLNWIILYKYGWLKNEELFRILIQLITALN